MSDSQQDVAGALISALADGGEHVDDGGFTLDAATALAKLREHQLSDPHEYLLLLVEAAWISDRSGWISIECRSTTTALLRGPSLDPAGLRELFASVFGKTKGLDGEALRRARVLQMLALAANSARALEPELITIDARDERGQSWRLRVDPSGELSLGPGEPLEPGRIRFRLHGRGNGMVRARAERDLVLERCAALGWLEGSSKFSVKVDGAVVSKGSRQQLRHKVGIRVDGRKIGVAGFFAKPHPGRAWIVNRGVGIPLDVDTPDGFLAVVEADLPMDLSRKRIIEGPELDAIRQAVAQAQRELKPPKYLPTLPESPKSVVQHWPLAFALFWLAIVLLPILRSGCGA